MSSSRTPPTSSRPSRPYATSMKDRIILDLCGGTGAWSQPYAEAGYDVRLVTLPDIDVKTYRPPQVWGVLAAPPCTEFARCGARWWASKPPEKLIEGLSVVLACLRVIAEARPTWWVLENPVGRLKHYIGPPEFIFDPWEYGDPWTKKTWLWGRFQIPTKFVGAVKPQNMVRQRISGQRKRTDFHEARILEAIATRPDWIHRLPPSKDRAALRSITPPGFARAFFRANP